MKRCGYISLSNHNFDSLSEKEFDEFLEHTDSCAYHFYLLEKYNESMIPLLREAMPERISSGKTRKTILREAWQSLRLRMRRTMNGFNDLPKLELATGLSVSGIIVVLLLATNSGFYTNVNRDLIISSSVILTGIAALMILASAFLPKLKRFHLSYSVGMGNLQTYHFDNVEETLLGIVPEKHQPKDITDEEKAVSLKIKEIMSTGCTVEKCRKVLKLLDENDFIVRVSWMNTLNKARAFIGIGERDEARKLVEHVLNNYSGIREAVGSAYEVFSWIEEIEYNIGGKVDEESLDKRMSYINKGLQFYPEYYQLWINAFEVTQLRKTAEAEDEAIIYLNKLMQIDREIARQYFLDNPKAEEVMKSYPKLKIKTA